MQLNVRTELVKKLDQHECIFSCTSEAPIDFLLFCVDEFKAYLEKRKQEIEAEKLSKESNVESSASE